MKGEILDSVALLMHERDNVATTVEDLSAGAAIDTDEATVTLPEDVPFGHKVALEPIEPGDPVYKYGERIGNATESIEPGEWVHTHNCESARGRGDLADGTAAAEGERS